MNLYRIPRLLQSVHVSIMKPFAKPCKIFRSGWCLMVWSNSTFIQSLPLKLHLHKIHVHFYTKQLQHCFKTIQIVCQTNRVRILQKTSSDVKEVVLILSLRLRLRNLGMHMVMIASDLSHPPGNLLISASPPPPCCGSRSFAFLSLTHHLSLKSPLFHPAYHSSFIFSLCSKKFESIKTHHFDWDRCGIKSFSSFMFCLLRKNTASLT